MESNFNNRDFERFLKQNADQYRMFPSENVWKGIHGTLHTRRRWYGIALALLLLTTGTVTWVMLTGPSARKNQVTINKPATAKTVQKEQPVVITPLKVKTTNSEVLIASPDNHQKNLFLANQVVEKNTIDVQIAAEYKQLENALERNQEIELETNKNQIKKLLQEELIIRYQYREGLYDFYTKNNLEIEKAVELLNNQTKYKTLLKK